MKLWIVRHWHRFGDTCWPVWQENQPTLAELLANDSEFAANYEGEGRISDDDNDIEREDEGIEVSGPFVQPNPEPNARIASMDPNATLERLLEAYDTCDWDGIKSATTDLLDWIKGGGLLPSPTEPQLSALLIMARVYGAEGASYSSDYEA